MLENCKIFLNRKNVVINFQRYCIDAMSAMALGLFSSLIIGLIMKEIGNKIGLSLLAEFGVLAMSQVGSAIGVAVAYSLQAPPMVLFCSVITGFAGNSLGGGPAGAFFAALVGGEIGKLVSKETKVDIIVTPFCTIFAGLSCAKMISPIFSGILLSFGDVIIMATKLMPLPMGMIISVVMGIVLTLPISSAALSMMLQLNGLAAGAATAGCCAQMVGFAVASFKENGFSGLLSQGLGTSMLQFPNIMKNPYIWVPPTLASAITGPISTIIFKMENIPEGAGMGTSGLVGQFCTFTAMGTNKNTILGVLIVHFLLPALISYIFTEIFYKKGIIKPGDMKL